MKKIYMILGAALISGGVFGQVNKPKAQLDKGVDARIAPTAAVVNQNTDRAVIWTNSFDDPADWTLGDSGPVGLTFQIGTGLEPTGAAPIAAIESATYDDGIAMVDSDGFANQTGIENCWFQTANPIDFTDHPYVNIEFANQYYMWDNGTSDGNEYCLVELSTDGVTWPDVSTYEVEDADPGTRFELWPGMSTQDEVLNPTMVRFNISEVAGGESEVWIRFRWVGTYGYAWMVDDITIFDGFSVDLGVQGQAFANGSSYTNLNGATFVPIEEVDGEIFTGLEYFKYPESQRPEIMAYTPVINWGDTDIADVVLSGEFNGTSVSADPVAIAAGEANDSLAVLSWPTEGLAVGDYDFALTVGTGEVLDEDPSNDSAIASLEMTEFIYARDDNNMTGQFPGTNNQGVGFRAGNLFEIFGDATVYAIDIALTSNSTAGEEVQVTLFDGTDLESVLGESDDDVVIYDQNFNAFDGSEPIWATIVLDEPVDVVAGDLVFPAFTYEGGPGMQLGEAQAAADQTTFIFGDFGDNGIDWYFTNDVAMVRLNFNPNAVTSVGEVDKANAFGLGQNIPNPSNGNTVINYEIFQTGNVTFEVFDVTGKQVFVSYEGQRGAGDYTIELDTDELTSGIYTYSLTVGEEKLTKKMIVE